MTLSMRVRKPFHVTMTSPGTSRRASGAFRLSLVAPSTIRPTIVAMDMPDELVGDLRARLRPGSGKTTLLYRLLRGESTIEETMELGRGLSDGMQLPTGFYEGD